MPVSRGGGEERISHAPDSDNCASFLPSGGSDAVFVFLLDIGEQQVAVGYLDKKGKGLRVLVTGV